MRVMISGQSYTVFQNLSCHWLITAYLKLSSHADSTIFNFTKFYKNGWSKRDFEKDESTAKKNAGSELERVFNKKDEDVPEEVTLAKINKKTLHIKWTHIFYDSESAKDKTLEADSNLEVWQFAKA